MFVSRNKAWLQLGIIYIICNYSVDKVNDLLVNKMSENDSHVFRLLDSLS